MQIFIKDLDYKLWEIISKGDFVPIIKEGVRIVSKSRSDFFKEETKKLAKNYRALNVLFYGLDSNDLILCLHAIQLKKFGHFKDYL